MKYHRTTGRQNIYRNFTYLWFEVLHTKKITHKNFDDHFVLHDLELFNKLINQKKGLIVVAGHFGNFEWTTVLFGIKGYSYNAVAKRQSNPYVNKFITDNREYSGGRIIYVKKALKE